MGNTCFADKLPDEINEMKIKDEKSEKVGFSRTCLFTFVLYFPFVDIYIYIYFLVAGSGSSSGGWKSN